MWSVSGTSPLKNDSPKSMILTWEGNGYKKFGNDVGSTKNVGMLGPSGFPSFLVTALSSGLPSS